MNMILEQVREFADRSHGTQQRKYTPDRYIVHPLRVMETCARYTDRLPVLAAALLHDVLEDTPVDERQLHQFLLGIMQEDEAVQTTKLVVELSDIYTKTAYPRWNRRKRKRKEAERIQKISGESQTIKYADIIDNCREIVEHDPDFAAVFLLECRSLLRAMKDGSPALREEAFTVVNNCLERVPREYRRY